MAKLIHITLGHKAKGGDDSPAVLYSGPSRSEALSALKAEGYAFAEYGCFRATKRRRGATPAPAVVADSPADDQPAESPADERKELRAQLDAAGISYHKNAGVAKLRELVATIPTE